MEHKEDSFRFTYSAPQQSEVERIRSKYVAREESKLERLRRLDRSATAKARGWAITVGTVGALILGTGMSLMMTDLGAVLNLPHPEILGIVVGVAGLIPVALAWPVYRRVLQRERKRIAPEVLRLADELTK